VGTEIDAEGGDQQIALFESVDEAERWLGLGRA
jgi:hypothetical protein